MHASAAASTAAAAGLAKLAVLLTALKSVDRQLSACRVCMSSSSSATSSDDDNSTSSGGSEWQRYVWNVLKCAHSLVFPRLNPSPGCVAWTSPVSRYPVAGALSLRQQPALLLLVVLQLLLVMAVVAYPVLMPLLRASL